MTTIRVDFPLDDWVWLCEFLNEVLKHGDLDQHSRDDTEHLLSLLQSAEQGA